MKTIYITYCDVAISYASELNQANNERPCLMHIQQNHVTISTVRGVGSDTNVLCNFRYNISMVFWFNKVLGVSEQHSQ